jgi:hypothetical protein
MKQSKYKDTNQGEVLFEFQSDSILSMVQLKDLIVQIENSRREV